MSLIEEMDIGISFVDHSVILSAGKRLVYNL